MEGEEERSEKEGSFSKASIPKRIAIVAAGATVNIIFAIIVYFILSATSGNNVSNIVKDLQENYAAQQSGIQVGDKILKINNKKIIDNTDINEILEKTGNNEVTVLIESNNEKQEIKLVPTEVPYKSTGIYISKNSTKIAAIEKNSAAERASLQVGDEILEINNEEVKDNPDKMIELLNDKETTGFIFNVERNGKKLEIEVVPDEKSAFYLGVLLEYAEDNFVNNVKYAYYDTGDFLVSIVDNLKQLFSGKTGTAELMGPVGISEVVAKTNGIREFVYMLALISMSLGVTNLIPFPPLDGGKILFLIIEAIRKKPLKEEIEIKIQLLGFAILIGLSVFITYNDLLRIF